MGCYTSTLISDTTYFKLRKEVLLVSLKAWPGDIEPLDTLEEAWVQIRGVPPKWSIWRCFRQIAPSLGKMLEIDWNSLFSSFFSMVRIKMAYKDITKIPKRRLYEMNNKLYLIQFKVEGSSGLGEDEDGDNGEPGKEDDSGMEELHHDSMPEGKK
jgi:hypothetical protein